MKCWVICSGQLYYTIINRCGHVFHMNKYTLTYSSLTTEFEFTIFVSSDNEYIRKGINSFKNKVKEDIT